MRFQNFSLVFLLLNLLIPLSACSQPSRFPFNETFDTILPPELPKGWTSTMNVFPGNNDFTVVASVPLSGPNALVSTNASITQALTSPLFDFSESLPESLSFYSRRSSSHLSPLIVEVSVNGGDPIPLSDDTLWNPDRTDYIRRAFKLPDSLAGSSSVAIRWRIVAGSGGTSGTLRLDDVTITARNRTDLSLESLTSGPGPILPEEQIQIFAAIRNSGYEALQEFTLSLFLDGNKDSVAQEEELASTTIHSSLIGPGDSVLIQQTLELPESGTWDLIGVATVPGDQQSANDTLFSRILVGYPSHSLVINEIMYSPLSGSSEYVELYNPGPVPIDLDSWLIIVGGTEEFLLGDSSIPLEAGAFCVLAGDSSILTLFPDLPDQANGVLIVADKSISLNNGGDDIRVVDPAGGPVDSLFYLPSWHHPEIFDQSGRSLEKISPSLSGNHGGSWTTCTLPIGGTPGKANSVYGPLPPMTSTIMFTPNPFPRDGDGFEDFTVIRFALMERVSTILLRIYDSRGRQIRQLAANEPSGSTGQIVWDGYDDDGNRARVGMYIVYLEARDAGGRTVSRVKGIVVLATRL